LREDKGGMGKNRPDKGGWRGTKIEIMREQGKIGFEFPKLARD